MWHLLAFIGGMVIGVVALLIVLHYALQRAVGRMFGWF